MPLTSENAATPARRAVIYLRISLDRELDGLAIERQRTACEKLVAERGWSLVETYVDQSRSAYDKRAKRPGYDSMVADYAAGRFDALVCWDLDRLTRQPRQLEDWIDAAEERGLAIVTASGEADLTTQSGRLFARIKASVARGESEQKSARQKLAQTQRARQGRPPKGVRPLGYALDGSVIADEAEAVRAIYTAFDSGATLRAIARGLSGDPEQAHLGVPARPRHTWVLVEEANERRREQNRSLPPQQQKRLREHRCGRDDPWPASTVTEILRNPRYAGYSTYTPTDLRRRRATENRDTSRRRSWREIIVRDEDGKPVLGQWEPIVDESLWLRVQAALDDPSRAANVGGDVSRRHLGSGLYLCGVCGRPVRSYSRAYRCPEGCVTRTRSHIDDYVAQVVAARLSQPDALGSVDADQPVRLPEIETEIEALHSRIAAAEADYAEGLIEALDLKRARDAARSRIDALEIERVRLARGHTGRLPILGTADPAAAFTDADLETRRRVVDVLMAVTLHRAQQGRKGFDPDSVGIAWKS